ncbi:MAG TPA: PfkB family carbohydrate kinase [Bacteroidales bacterium]|nr:PfkB family carbohydrate kinase [Bacteroidales bacterium]
MSLLVVGSVAFDQVETPFGKTGKILGGAGTYISLSASHLTDKISLISVVGGDFPEKYLNLFKERNIDLSGLKVVKDGKSFFWSGRYHQDMNTRETLTTDLNVLAQFEPVVPGHARNSKFLMLGNLTPAIQKQVIKQMETRPQIIAMDTMNFWMNTAWDDLIEVLGMVDVLTINDEEARQLSGEYSIKKAAKKILMMGPKYLIVKKGEHGALLFTENQSFYAPAIPLENVVDPTGAGDAFAGGFMGYLVKKEKISFETIKNALIYGSVLASFTVESFGAENLLQISSKDIENRLNEFVKLVQFKI